jgi:hypothetical protein
MNGVNIEVGKQYRCPYPFVWDTYLSFNEDGPCDIDTIRPGVRYEDVDVVEADVMGEMVLDVISIHKPGKYPERVFYVRSWVGPDGKQFGKKCLRITTMANFKIMMKGYRYRVEVAA